MKASPLRRAPRVKLLCALVASCFAAEAYANPTGPAVASGTAAFSTVGSTLTVTNSPNAIINWQGFSIAASEATRFQQQSAASAVLNRVVGQDPSMILGTLWSNGRVFLVNPNGVLFGQGSRVDVAGLVASTLNITDGDFLGGRLNFQSGAIANSLVNQGELHSATGGHIYLIAPDVTNSGIITSPKGEVVLAAGRSVSLVDIGTPNLKVEITAPDNEARNLGQIVADSGRIGVYAGLISHSGTIRADSAVATQDGRIVLRATKSATLEAGSLISASGPKGGSIAVESGEGLTQLAGRIEAKGDATTIGNDGGSVTIKADRLINTGLIDATGAAGGSVNLEANRYLGSGTIKASGAAGDGGSASILAKEYLVQTEAESIATDGGGSGKGGAVTVQAAQRVFSSASVSAHGAGEAKRGGEVRVLADEVMLFGARIDASGEGGGTVLIGGDYKGGNPAIPNASRTWVNYSTTISADAGQQGDGGKVIIWSDKDTRYAGDVSARGGAQSGNGGFIEVSGKDSLIFAGTADASAPNGTPGTVLLDPKNIVIDSTGSGLSSFLLVDPNVGTSDGFGQQVVVLSNNNVVVTDPFDDFVALNSGAVYLFNGATGALISTLTGSSASDSVGSGVIALTNGNYVVKSPNWNNGTVVGAGAVTFGNGTTGISGVVSSSNSLVGTTASDFVGGFGLFGVTALTNGNYVARSPNWDNGTVVNAGAVTFGSGTSGISGAVSSSNSLVGTTASDSVGTSVTALTNGNYVVVSQNWNNGTATLAGAVTFGNGTSGISGVVSSSNSLVGTTASDSVGSSGVTALTNGNYVVNSPSWDNGTTGNVGAVTFGNGTSGISGVVSSSNSLVGTTASDSVGSHGVTALTNGNYVVRSSLWNNGAVVDAGAVTFGSGTSGISGAVSSSNSLVGTMAGDVVGNGGVTALANGNYVVISPSWANGSTASDAAGAVTFGNGTTGISGAVSSSNSLVGTTLSDLVGGGGVTALTNGNYVVSSPNWNNGTVVDAGAVTFGNGTTGISGVVSSSNSLVGTKASDSVGYDGATALTNGNYVVRSTVWNNGTVVSAGAVTFGSGTTGISGAVSSSNSLVGTTASDSVGSGGVTALPNGNYVVVSEQWNNGTASLAGAVTFANGTTGISGAVSSSNSLVGSTTNDRVGIGGITVLTNGNYVVHSPNWSGDKGAATFGSGTTGVTGIVSSANSLVGNVANDLVTCPDNCEVVVVPFANGNYAVVSAEWDNGTIADVGAVTFGSGVTGVSGTVSAANSLLGTTAGDRLGSGGVTGLSNGSFVVSSPNADNGAIVDAGLVHVAGFANLLSFSNNAAGTTTISPFDIATITNTGSALTLQANNDITVNSAVTTNNPSGAGGAITMQAGRSVLINANITTDDANLNITANDAAAQAANRDTGPGGITMSTGTTLNAGTGTVSLTVGPGPGVGTSGNLVVENIIATNVNLQQEGQTNGSGIVRASSSSLIQATNLLMEVDLVGTTGTGVSIGTSTEPMRVAVTNLEAHTHEASSAGGGIFIESPNQGLTIGGVSSFGGLVKGVQNVISGDIRISVKGTLSNPSGTSVCGSSASGTDTGGPICTPSGSITLRADDMSIGHSVNAGAGTVTLAPYTSGGTFKIQSTDVGNSATFTVGLTPAELANITAGTLAIGEVGTGNIDIVGVTLSAPILNLTGDNISVGSTSATAATTVSSSTGAMTINAAGAFTVQGGNSGSGISALVQSAASQDIAAANGFTVQAGTGTGADATVIAAAGQMINAKFVDIFGDGTSQAIINNTTSGTQRVITTGMDTDTPFGRGIAVVNSGSGLTASLANNGSGLQWITVSNADRVRVHGLAGDASIFSNGSQTITVHGTGLNRLDVGGPADVGSSVIRGKSQQIVVGDSGEFGQINLQAGVTNLKGAVIRNDSGDQSVSTTGAITALGGSATGGTPGTCADSGACAEIFNASTGQQTITADSISLTGGGTGVGNKGAIFVSGGVSEINVGAGGLSLQGGGGTSDNSAVIGGAGANGSTITLNVTGTTTLTGGSSANSSAFIGLGSTGTGETITLFLNPTGDLILTGGSAGTGSGSAIGAGINTVNATANITINAGANVTLNPGSFSGSRIGHPSASNGPGDISITAAGTIALNSAPGIGSAIRTLGNVTLDAASITEGADSLIIAGGTTTLNGGAISLTSASNDFTGAVSVNNSGANDVAITDANAIVLGTSNVGSGTLTVTAGGSITQTGPIVQAAGAGQASFLTSGVGSAITLSDTGNDFTGPVDTDTTGAVTITDANSFIIKGGGIGGGGSPTSFTVNANGTVSQSATFTGTAPAVVVINAGSGPILLNDPTNNFSGNTSVAVSTTGAASVVNTNAAGFNLAASSVGGALSLTSGGPITQSGPITVGGASTLNAGSNPITLTNSGNDFTGAVGLTGSNVGITDANAITIGASSVSGTFDISATSVLFSGGLSVNNYSFTGGTYTLSSGTYNLGGTTTVASPATVVASGATINASGGTINVSGVLDSGTSSLTTGTLNVLSGGTLKGTGTIVGNVNNSAGTVSPGASPGILTINGNYVQGSGGTLDMQIGGTTAGSQYDQLVVSGTTTLGGTLNTTLINGFVPTGGETFTLIQSSGALSGTFATIVQPTGTTFNTFYGPTTFEFIAPGTSVFTVVEPNLNYTVAALDSPLQPLLEPNAETAPGSEIVVAPIAETTPTTEEQKLAKKPPACN